ncbi:MAG: hypothetical protein KJZ64_15365, partial [Sphingomonadaceae bacterium]|nr:hypothetical protein [Sphingomonadaceae bacterium]
MLVSTVIAGAALAIPAGSALAQGVPGGVTPPTRDELIPPSQEQRRQGATLTIDGQLQRAPCALDRAEYSDIKLSLTGAEFIGLDRVPGLSLADSYAGYTGREMPLSALCDIQAKANARLQELGYLATVEIPEQSLADGVADFRVVFGRLTALRVRGERELVLQPLPLPDPAAQPATLLAAPAVALFLERARAARPSFA